MEGQTNSNWIMKRLRENNINTTDYLNKMKLKIDFRNTLRQDEYLKYVQEGDSVLELGCGLSPFLDMAYNKLAKNCTGIDHNQRLVLFREKENPNIRFRVGDVLNTQLETESFDTVLAGEVIEHIDKPEELIKEMVRLTKKGGTMILSTPILEFDDPEHIWQFSEKSIMKLLKPYGKTVAYTINSDKFKGRSYIFSITIKL